MFYIRIMDRETYYHNTIASRPSRRQIGEVVFNGPSVIAPAWSNPAQRISGREPNRQGWGEGGRGFVLRTAQSATRGRGRR
jgi:acyl-CoA synthetase (AMP-forming)/AMP-acid ligase II